MTSLAPFLFKGKEKSFFTMSECKNMRALKFFVTITVLAASTLPK